MDVGKTIVLTGPESSGKSWLGRKLAEHYNGLYIPEYARIYLEQNGNTYDFDGLTAISKLHKDFQQSKVAHADTIVFADTDLTNYYIWQDIMFGKVSPWVKNAMKEETNHRYLLLFPDIAWEADSLRNNSDNREELFETHKSLLEKLGRRYEVVRGDLDTRFSNAQKAVEKLL